MKNCDYWKRFFNTGKIDDYLSYIACTREECSEEISISFDNDKKRDIVNNMVPDTIK